MDNKTSEFIPVFCPVLKENVDPRLCYETRFGITNILKSVGISEDDSMNVCRENCKKIRGFIENATVIRGNAVAEESVPYQQL